MWSRRGEKPVLKPPLALNHLLPLRNIATNPSLATASRLKTGRFIRWVQHNQLRVQVLSPKWPRSQPESSQRFSCLTKIIHRPPSPFFYIEKSGFQEQRKTQSTVLKRQNVFESSFKVWKHKTLVCCKTLVVVRSALRLSAKMQKWHKTLRVTALSGLAVGATGLSFCPVWYCLQKIKRKASLSQSKVNGRESPLSLHQWNHTDTQKSNDWRPRTIATLWSGVNIFFFFGGGIFFLLTFPSFFNKENSTPVITPPGPTLPFQHKLPGF